MHGTLLLHCGNMKVRYDGLHVRGLSAYFARAHKSAKGQVPQS